MEDTIISDGGFTAIKRAKPDGRGLYTEPGEIIGPDGIRGAYTVVSNYHLDEILELHDPVALAVYSVLCRYRDNKSRVVHASIRWVADYLGCCPKTVRKKLHLLDGLERPPIKVWWPEPHSGKRLRIMILDRI